MASNNPHGEHPQAKTSGSGTKKSAESGAKSGGSKSGAGGKSGAAGSAGSGGSKGK